MNTPKAYTLPNADLHLIHSAKDEQHAFWIYGGTWHVYMLGGVFCQLDTLSDAQAYALAEQLLKDGAHVGRAGRPYRNLWNADAGRYCLGVLPKQGYSRNDPS